MYFTGNLFINKLNAQYSLILYPSNKWSHNSLQQLFFAVMSCSSYWSLCLTMPAYTALRFCPRADSDTSCMFIFKSFASVNGMNGIHGINVNYIFRGAYRRGSVGLFQTPLWAAILIFDINYFKVYSFRDLYIHVFTWNF